MLYHHRGTVGFDHFDKYFHDGPDEDAILYLGMATTLTRALRPGAIIVAEDMSGMPGLCRPTSEEEPDSLIVSPWVYPITGSS